MSTLPKLPVLSKLGSVRLLLCEAQCSPMIVNWRTQCHHFPVRWQLVCPCFPPSSDPTSGSPDGRGSVSSVRLVTRGSALPVRHSWRHLEPTPTLPLRSHVWMNLVQKPVFGLFRISICGHLFTILALEHPLSCQVCSSHKWQIIIGFEFMKWK